MSAQSRRIIDSRMNGASPKRNPSLSEKQCCLILFAYRFCLCDPLTISVRLQIPDTSIRTFIRSRRFAASECSLPACVWCAAVGCPDIGDVENAVVERRFDLAIIRCNVSTQTYFLTCVNTRWTGEMSPCTAGRLEAFISG